MNSQLVASRTQETEEGRMDVERRSQMHPHRSPVSFHPFLFFFFKSLTPTAISCSVTLKVPSWTRQFLIFQLPQDLPGPAISNLEPHVLPVSVGTDSNMFPDASTVFCQGQKWHVLIWGEVQVGDVPKWLCAVLSETIQSPLVISNF